MDASRLKTQRRTLRTSFTVCANKMEDELKKVVPDMKQLSVWQTQITDKYARLEMCQNSITELLLKNEDEESKTAFEEDFLSAEEYRDKFSELNAQIQHIAFKESEKTSECFEKRKFKLPKIELKKFSGDVKEYLTFWSQFAKIHDDPGIPSEDKFQYLLQAVVPKSRAARVVESFPATAENYSKAISQLKERFGRDDLLVQVYVRDLLTMVMKNAVVGRSKTNLPTLYDELESKIQALESLGRTQEKYGEFLSPLIESAVPRETLLAWERSRSMKTTPEAESRSLENLMNFLKQEVKGEEMLELARTGFASSSLQKRETVPNVDNFPSAAALVGTHFKSNAGRRTWICVFCSNKHPSRDCIEARDMSLDEKRRCLLKHRACFSCFSITHFAKSCKVKHSCLYCNSKLHHTLMCDHSKDSNKSSVNETNSLANSNIKHNVFLMSLFVNVSANGKVEKFRCLIDTGSQYSYLSRYAVEKLGIEPLDQITMQHMLFGGRETQSQIHDVFKLRISSLDGSFALNINAFSEEKICGNVPKLNCSNVINELKKRGINLSDLESSDCEINLLLGADVVGYLFMKKPVKLGSGLFLLNTRLGFVLTGKQDALEKSNENSNAVLDVISVYVNNASINELWDLESIGIYDPIQKLNKINEHLKVVEDFKNDIKILPDGRYQLRLPFKSKCMNTSELPSNKELTWKRHRRMCERATRDGLLEDYKAVFKEWEYLKIIEKVEGHSETSHFLPHRPVVKIDSTTKIRPVFDASARETGKSSLNDFLHKGPNLIEQIPDIIDRFRSNPIGISADIEKAFLQLAIAPEHRDFLRFFFPTGNEQIVYRHRRVVFGVSSSPFMLGAVLSHLLEHVPTADSEVADKLKLSFYVDNCVSGVRNIRQQEEFILNARNILARGCFNLRNWESNVGSKYISKSVGTTKVLGLLWDLDRDVLKCNINVDDFKSGCNITKRFILMSVQKIFDPLGILCSATLLPKILLQETWKLKFSWDSPLPDDIVKPFLKWWGEVDKLAGIEIPRYIDINDTTQMHVFVDACKDSYATCIFIRSDTAQGVKVSLVRAKSRVAPLKPVTIPRLELMACCIGARLAHSVQQALNINMETIFWSDSMVALYWLRDKGEWSVFVSNRIKEIKTLFPVSEWRYVPGKNNPADLISRGCTPSHLVNSRWWEGPSWLVECPETWPVTEVSDHETPEISLERKKVRLCNLNITEEKVPWYAKKFSRFHSILRLVAWVLRFVNNVKSSIDKRTGGELTLEEIESAEIRLIRSVQVQNFPDENSIPNLCVFKDNNNILRVKTRITERIDTTYFLSPILLPNNCIFTQRLVEHFHRENYHAGTQLLLSIIREKYWITGGRRFVRKIWNACVRCRRFKSKSPGTDPVSLPADRVGNTAVFEVSAADLAGPLYLKRGNKSWIVLYTCAVYRAVHMELVSSLSTDAFLLSLRRFIARRGRPRVIYSDNGTNFRGAFNELAAIDWSEVSRYAEIQRITWKFIPPTAAWWGGFWERLVRTVKELLRRSLGKAIFSYEELLTILCECEKVVNSRPLTYLSEDMLDLTPITPAMFLSDIKTAEVKDLDMRDANHFRKRLRFRAKVIEGLRKRFRIEYLGLLFQRQKQVPQSYSIQQGDIVLIGDDVKKRLQWPLARVLQLIPGKDGVVRTVKLKTQSSTLIRPIQRVFPLEVSGKDLTSLPLQKIQPTESKRSSGADSSKVQPQVTRYGRVIKKPKRLNVVP